MVRGVVRGRRHRWRQVVGVNPAWHGTQVIPFGAGMERPPQYLTQTTPIYTKEAMAMHVTGVALVKCVINLDGSLSDCRITKSIPYMDAAILESLRSWKFTPVMYQGHPQRVDYIITYRISG